MSTPVFIGDELDGVGFRLAGITVLDVPEDQLEASFRQACEEAPLVILAASTANILDSELLEKAMRDAAPPIAIVRDITGEAELPDMETEVRIALGVAS